MRLVLLSVLLVVSVSHAKKLEEKYSWKELDFAWPSEEVKQGAIKSGKYIESHNLPLGLEVWRDKVFITVPRYGSLLDNNLFHFSTYMSFKR
jgi:hypothetical protein